MVYNKIRMNFGIKEMLRMDLRAYGSDNVEICIMSFDSDGQ